MPTASPCSSAKRPCEEVLPVATRRIIPNHAALRASRTALAVAAATAVAVAITAAIA